jgi:predicted metal-binding membrane protein
MSTAPQPFARQRNLLLGSLLLLAAGAWLLLALQARRMSSGLGLTAGMGAPLFLATWVVMMVAMMFPSSAPMVLMFARIQAGKRRQGAAFVSTWVFVSGYLAIWALFGVIAYSIAAGAQQLAQHWSWAPAARSAPAGLYQLSPLKRTCLSKCRSPLAFVLGSWHDGRLGAVRMGLEHGAYCTGCCWLLFAILFPLGVMNIAIMAVLTAFIFAEKALPLGNRTARLGAATLVAYGIGVILIPGALSIGV